MLSLAASMLKKFLTCRRLCVMLSTIAIMSICGVLIGFSAQSDLMIAAEIFIVSALGFSAIAFITSHAALRWRLVDFPWICASFAAIVVALLNISEASRRERFSLAKTEVGRAFTDLLYATQSTITNDCPFIPVEPSFGWQASPAPYADACSRMRHFLPQMQNAYYNYNTDTAVNDLRIWSFKILVPDTSPVGSWVGLYQSARHLDDVVDLHRSGISEGLPAKLRSDSGKWQQFILSSDLKYWYFMMAFFVGLRLSKTTAEVRQVVIDRNRCLQ